MFAHRLSSATSEQQHILWPAFGGRPPFKTGWFGLPVGRAWGDVSLNIADGEGFVRQSHRRGRCP
jgi:hypothetical protein